MPWGRRATICLGAAESRRLLLLLPLLLLSRTGPRKHPDLASIPVLLHHGCLHFFPFFPFLSF